MIKSAEIKRQGFQLSRDKIELFVSRDKLQNNNIRRDLSGFRLLAIKISALLGCDVT
jgi:hypothetical protein